MIGFFHCPSSCVFPGYYSWEGICPLINLALFISYICALIVLSKFIIFKLKKKYALSVKDQNAVTSESEDEK